MPLEFYVSVHKARVGHGELRQQDLRVLDDARTFVIASALGVPRLWGYTLDAALNAFVQGLSRPHDGRTSTRLHQGLDAAQRAVREHVDHLIERRMPDVSLLALSLEGPKLHVLCVGPGRAFLQHGSSTRRLTARDDRAEGLLKATPSWCAEPVSPGDLVFAGSLTACSEESLSKLNAALSQNPQLSALETTRVLNKSAAAHGLGAAAIAFRVPKF